MAKVSPLVFVPPVVFLGLFALFAVGNFREGRNDLPSTREGGAAPALQIEAFQGRPVPQDADLRRGEVTLVNYWASWCAPCRAEHPHLTDLAEEGLTIVGINYKDDPAKAQAFLTELGDPYASIGADPNGRTALDWGLYGVPETFVLAGDGTVVLRFAGPITSDILENRIRPAIAEAAGGS